LRRPPATKISSLYQPPPLANHLDAPCPISPRESNKRHKTLSSLGRLILLPRLRGPRSRGVEMFGPHHFGDVADAYFFYDPDDNLVEFFAYVDA